MTANRFYAYSVIIAVWCTLLTFFLSYSLEKRKHYWIRTGILIVAVYFATVFLNLIPFGMGPFFNSALRFVFVIVFCSLACFACYKVRYTSSLLLSFTGYTIRHMVYLICQIFCFIFKDTIPGFTLNFYLSNYLFTFVFYIFFTPFLLNIKKLIEKYKDIILVPPMMTIFVSGVAIFVDVIFNNFSMFYFNGINLTVKYWMNSFNVVLCILILMIIFGYVKQVQVQSQVAIMNQLEYQRNSQLLQSKETMEIINIKCHDLRHQIRELENISDLNIQKELNEIEKQLRIYDTKVKTGNDYLDVILSEKSLLCRKNEISLDCIIDGKQIEFLSPGEISSLFGNIIDNAMESLSKMDNDKMKIITLKIETVVGGTLIIEENPYIGKVEYIKGKIVTTKEEKQYHGYGLKSIQNVVDRHDGILKIDTDNSLFRLKIFFPKKLIK